MKNLLFIFLFLLSLTAVFYPCTGMCGDNITGRWEGTFEAEGFGTLPVGMDLKANGTKLTGTYDSMTGPVPISNGKIDGNKISFDLTLDIMGDKVDFKYKGKVSGKTMNLTWTSERGTTNAVVTRK